MAKKRSNIDILLSALDPKDKQVVDIGSGDGELCHSLAAAGAKVTGIEPNPNRVRRAQGSAGPNETFLVGGGEHLPCADASMDIVVFFNSLHHIPVASMDAALREAARVVKPGGILYVSEPVAAGSMYEAMKIIRDEAEVRNQALAALKRTVGKGLFREESEEINEVVRCDESFESFCRRMIDTDPAREEVVTAKKEEIRALFLAHTRKTEQGYELDSLTRFNLLRRV